MNIYIVIDTSGSMDEMGKIHLQRNLSRFAVQLQKISPERYAEINIQLYQWERNISEITVQSNGDIQYLITGGSPSLCELVDFLSQYFKDTEKVRLLILSDGYFANSDILSFQSQRSTFTDLIIRTVAVGADADLLRLKKISTNNTVYLAENIASAIDSTIFGSDEPLAAPVSTAQIRQSTPAETKEPEGDWDA